MVARPMIHKIIVYSVPPPRHASLLKRSDEMSPQGEVPERTC